MDKTLKMNLLFDFYGPLLTERQQDVFKMYFDEDLSLGEISGQLGISRQAVYDILKRSAASLEEFESKLMLVSKHQDTQSLFKQIEEQLRRTQLSLIDLNLTTQAQEIESLHANLKQILADS